MNKSKLNLFGAWMLFALFLLVTPGCDLGNSTGPKPVRSDVPNDLSGEWEGAITAILNYGRPDAIVISSSIHFTFDDSTYASFNHDGTGRKAPYSSAFGPYERFNDTVIILQNYSAYPAIIDGFLLPHSGYPLHMQYRDGTLTIISPGSEVHPDWYGWQRIVLTRQPDLTD